VKRSQPIRIAAAILAAFAFLSPAASAHPFDTEDRPARNYAEAVHVVRDELREIHRSRESGDTAEVIRRASRLATFAISVPGFALTPSSALPDSAAGGVAIASSRLRAVAAALERDARSGDSSGVVLQLARCADLVAILDASLPAQYVCPMHCEAGRTYDRPGLCPRCQMHLQKVTSDVYSVEVRSAAPLREHSPASLTFRVRDPAGFEVRHFEIVHEKPMHLMIVSQDLARFDHVHPSLEADGSFSLRHVFPEGGHFFLFHDFTPDSVGMQVVPVELVVEGTEPATRPLVVDDLRPRRVDGCDVTISHTPLVPGETSAMTFSLSRHGRPVTDLEPFLGAAGHLVLISQDRASYRHSHPLETRPGSSVTFQVRFERTGLYKGWAQFQRHGRVLTVPFVVAVTRDAKDSPVPGSSSALR
jgi:hypothetical protein